MKLFMGVAVPPPPPPPPPTYHPVELKMDHPGINCREERLYLKIKVWSKVIAHELKNNELLGHPVLVFANVLVSKKIQQMLFAMNFEGVEQFVHYFNNEIPR